MYWKSNKINIFVYYILALFDGQPASVSMLTRRIGGAEDDESNLLIH